MVLNWPRRTSGCAAPATAGDIRLRRYEERSDRLLIFTVDASGSAALARLAEAKGAIEILLAEAYARRDHVCLIAFRGTEAELLLPPTRSLVQTKRRLAGLPGGGGTLRRIPETRAPALVGRPIRMAGRRQPPRPRAQPGHAATNP